MAAGPIAGCATLHIPDFPVPPAAGLKQAADEHAEVNLYVVRDQGDQRTYLGTELAQKGVLPVWLSVRNKSAHESIALDFRDVRIDAQGRAIAEPERAHAPVNTAGEQGVVLVGAALLSLPLLFGGAKMLSDSSEIKRNIMAKQLYSATIPPGGSASGFVYTAVDPAAQTSWNYEMSVILRAVPVPPGDAGWHYIIAF